MLSAADIRMLADMTQRECSAGVRTAAQRIEAGNPSANAP